MNRRCLCSHEDTNWGSSTRAFSFIRCDTVSWLQEMLLLQSATVDGLVTGASVNHKKYQTVPFYFGKVIWLIRLYGMLLALQ